MQNTRSIALFTLAVWLFVCAPAALAQGGDAAELIRPVPMTSAPARTREAAPAAVTTQAPADAPAAVTADAPAVAQAERSLPIDIEADRVEYRNNNKTAVLIGNAVVTQGESVFKADFISLDTETYEAHALGNIHVTHQGRIHTGEEFYYNFKSGEGDFGSFEMQQHPFFITAETSQRMTEGSYLVQNATLTTCEGDKPEFYIRSGDVEVVPDERIKARHVVLYYRGVPVFYLPVLSHDLDSTDTNLDVIPGYSDRMGAYLLTAYGYRLNEYVRGVTRLDIRSKRGLGVGQDFIWRERENNRWDGEFRVYYANDQEPYEAIDDEVRDEEMISEDRYRFKLRHRQNFTPADTLRVQSDYLSDPWVTEDFFDNEFRNNTQPENFAAYTHRDRQYTAGFEINSRVNDFYDNVNRLPEATFEVPTLQLGNTAFYYETRNSASYLERAFAEQREDAEDYDAMRIDTDHRVSFFSKHFGFLNLIPSVGYAATYYSSTVDRETSTNYVVSIEETTDEVTGEVSSETVEEEQITTMVFDQGADVRNVFELGLDTSFKAFKVIHERARNGNDVGLRHVVEPRAEYTYVPEPNVLPANLYQFDTIDRRREINSIQLGIRNKLQTKRRGRVQDLVDFDLFTYYRLSTVDEQEDFSDIFFDLELRPVRGVFLDLECGFDPYETTFDRLDAQVALVAKDRSSLAFEYIHRDDERDVITSDLRLLPGRPVGYAGYVRYDFFDSDLEEHSHLLTLKSDCVGWGIGFRETGDELQLWFQVWLTAMPRGIVELGR